jgi:hypothetical protein
MMNDEAIYAWIDGHFQSNQDIIEDFSSAQIKSFLQNQTYLMVFVCKSKHTFYTNIQVGFYFQLNKQTRIERVLIFFLIQKMIGLLKESFKINISFR